MTETFKLMFEEELAKFPDLKIRRFRKSNTGCYYSKSREIEIPEPKSRKSLCVCFHEIGHHCQGEIKPRYFEEMRAVQWSFDKMREYGLAVPKSMIEREKMYVVRKVNQALVRGHKNKDVLPEVLKWLGDYKDRIEFHSAHAEKFDHLRKTKGEF